MFELDTTAAVIAFVALGANFMGAALLLLFNPRNPAVRWYGLFVVTQLLWLGLQGVQLLHELSPGWLRLYAVDVHFMPALFCAAALVQRRGGRAGWVALVPVAAALLLLPFMRPNPLQSPLTLPWHIVAWGIPAVLYSWGRAAQRGRALNFLLGFTVPVGVVGAIALGGGFVLYMLPLMTIIIQLLIFTGVVHHRYYDIEVRAARTGELAAGAAELDRLALLGELAATVAHEVRNPLTGIRSLTERIAEAPLEEERRQQYASVILGEVERLDRIVGNLTDLAKRTTPQSPDDRPHVDVRALFGDLALLLESRARRAGVTLVMDGEGTLSASREALAQALLNLLLNAIAHSPPGGRVELRRDGPMVRVRDQGPGVPVEQRQAIFEPFRTTGRGTGLGLAVVRRLASEHGWVLDVAEAPGGGAEFRIVVEP